MASKRTKDHVAIRRWVEARRGKPAKVALTAVMRKLVVLADALIRDDREWAEITR